MVKVGGWNKCPDCGRDYIYPDLMCDIHRVSYMISPAPNRCGRCTHQIEVDKALRGTPSVPPWGTVTLHGDDE